jgi:hypothetical protein
MQQCCCRCLKSCKQERWQAHICVHVAAAHVVPVLPPSPDCVCVSLVCLHTLCAPPALDGGVPTAGQQLAPLSDSQAQHWALMPTDLQRRLVTPLTPQLDAPARGRWGVEQKCVTHGTNSKQTLAASTARLLPNITANLALAAHKSYSCCCCCCICWSDTLAQKRHVHSLVD